MIRLKPLDRRLKIVLLLAASQAACLAVGIWIQYLFALVLAEWNEQPVAAQSAQANATVASPTADGRPVPSEALREAMVSSLPFAFVWIAGSQTAVAYLVLMHMQGEHKQTQTRSKEVSLAKAKELVRTRDAVIFGLAKLAESRDQVTLGFVRSLGIGSVLHDIGKVGVSDSILLKTSWKN